MKLNLKKTILCVGLCALVGLLSTTQASAATNETMAVDQARKVTGRVSDSMGPLMGATVMEKGSRGNGVVTDLNGRFSIDVPSGATLVVSYMGYVTQEVRAGSDMNIVLKEEGHNINEVVVIGYGSQRRETVTGSVANIGGEKLNQIAATNAAQALRGRSRVPRCRYASAASARSTPATTRSSCSTACPSWAS